MGEGRRFSGGTPGVASLMVIFAVLCAATFAVLAVTTAMAGQRLSETSNGSVLNYYKADCDAERILAEIRGGRIPEGVECTGDIYTYACRISDNRELEVAVKFTGEEYNVLQWQAVNTNVWENEEDVIVWQGD